MAGIGSGRSGWRPHVEECRVLDVEPAASRMPTTATIDARGTGRSDHHFLPGARPRLQMAGCRPRASSTSRATSEGQGPISSDPACHTGVRVAAAWSSSIAAAGCSYAAVATASPIRAKARMQSPAPSAAPATSDSASAAVPTGGHCSRRCRKACGSGPTSACAAATLRPRNALTTLTPSGPRPCRALVAESPLRQAVWFRFLASGRPLEEPSGLLCGKTAIAN